MHVFGLLTMATKTPSTDLPYNFGLASSRDSVLYTCQRPGGDPTLHNTNHTNDGSNQQTQQQQHVSSSPKISLDGETAEQVKFMRLRGIQNVLILLEDIELEDYETPDGLLRLYESFGIKIYRQPMKEPGASKRILDILLEVESRNERIAAHCTHGMGRSGRVAAFWVASRYDQTPEEGTAEVMEFARANGIERMGDVENLKAWMR